MTTHIVSWSGGPDSTMLLIDLLRDNGSAVVTYTMHGNEGNDRQKLASERAVRCLYPAIARQYGDFVHHEYTMHARNQVRAGLEIVCFSAAVAGNYPDPVVYWATCKDDFYPGCFRDEVKHNYGQYRRIIESVGRLIEPEPTRTKAEIRRDLGPLWQNTWSCLMPDRALNPCGQCGKCIERAAAYGGSDD